MPMVKPIAIKEPRQTTTVDKGKGKATNTSKPLTSRRSTYGKATPAKTNPGTSRKTPASKASKPARKSRAPINITASDLVNRGTSTVRGTRKPIRLDCL